MRTEQPSLPSWNASIRPALCWEAFRRGSKGHGSLHRHRPRQTGPEQGGKGGETPFQKYHRDRSSSPFWLLAPATTRRELPRVRAGHVAAGVGLRSIGCRTWQAGPYGPRTQTHWRPRHAACSGVDPTCVCAGQCWATRGSGAQCAACPLANRLGPCCRGRRVARNSAPRGPSGGWRVVVATRACAKPWKTWMGL